jgi:hypothetical protein
VGGTISPLPKHASLAWCSVKKSTGTTLPFAFTRLKAVINIEGYLCSINDFSFRNTRLTHAQDCTSCDKSRSLQVYFPGSRTRGRTTDSHSVGQEISLPL